MELGFVENEAYGVDACLWIGHPGEAGLSGVANIIAGLANPSGKLVDTYAYDLSTAPSFYNTDNNRYTNMEDTEMYGYYQYEEGIYVGYRYYETADAEGYFDSDSFKDAVYKNDDRDASEGGARDEEGGYENVVQYPFGYGLSYGSFSQTIESSDIPLELHGTNTIDVTVTNEGDYESDSYVAASSRLTGTGEITGNVDVSELAFGTYHAKLNTFASSGTNPDPVSVEFTVSGKLSTPEFKIAQDGTNVTITLFSDTLTTYNEKEMFNEIGISICDESGAEVSTDTITTDDLQSSAMGPMTSYSCEKALTLDPGTYQISLTAKGDGGSIEDSDESEKLTVTVADGATSEVMTAGYVEQEGGMMP